MGFGTCDRCGGRLIPIWFTEEEADTFDGAIRLTGRIRKACSHLVCENCLKNFIVDDSFDGPWRRR